MNYKPEFPEENPKIHMKLNAELIGDNEKYSSGSMCMTMDQMEISLNKEKVGSVAYALGGGVFVSIGSRSYLVHLKDIFGAVYEAERKNNAEPRLPG